jgi:hypothetical protein
LQSIGIAEDSLIFPQLGKQVTEVAEPFGQRFEVLGEVGGHLDISTKSTFPLIPARDSFLNTIKKTIYYYYIYILQKGGKSWLLIQLSRERQK